MPSTTLRLLQRVPLDRTYHNTVRHTGNSTASILAAQKAYFEQFASSAFTLENLSYQRMESTFRVPFDADTCRRFNYLMYLNTGYGAGSTFNRWVYAFIDDVTYINDATCDIRFTIDLIQTYYTDFTIRSCFVDREHSEDDIFGKHIVKEDITGGGKFPQNVLNHYYSLRLFTVYVTYLPNITDTKSDIGSQHASFKRIHGWQDEDRANNTPGTWTVQTRDAGASSVGTNYAARITNGIYNPFQTISYVADGAEILSQNKLYFLTAKINEIGGKIVNIALVPNDYFGDSDKDTFQYTRKGHNYFESIRRGEEPISKYVPVNNKLYTSQYTNIDIRDNAGNSKEYSPEFLVTINPTAKIVPEVDTNVNITLELSDYPEYQGVVTVEGYLDESDNAMYTDISITSPWTEDNYTSYINRGLPADCISVLGSAVGSGIKGAASGGLPGATVGAGAAAVTGIASVIGNTVSAQRRQDNTTGSYSKGSGVRKKHWLGLQVYENRISAEDAKIIDDYFTMYGYAVREVKTPNLFKLDAKLRPKWNYLKTMSANVVPATTTSGLTASAMQDIANIFDNGITYWEPDAVMGDYTDPASNRPTEE